MHLLGLQKLYKSSHLIVLCANFQEVRVHMKKSCSSQQNGKSTFAKCVAKVDALSMGEIRDAVSYKLYFRLWGISVCQPFILFLYIIRTTVSQLSMLLASSV